MSFFKWYGGMQRKILSRFHQLFVQDAESKKLIDGIGLSAICRVAGDTRFDRVIEIAASSTPLPLIEKFIAGNKVLIAGSTWKNDEELLKKISDFLVFNKIKLIMAPHEVNPGNIEEIQTLFPRSLLYSSLSASQEMNADVLIIDNIGMLSTLYKYAWCSYVGGGLSRTGVHNVVEAVVYNKPVFFGPNYEKYREARELVAIKGAFAINGKEELVNQINHFILNPNYYHETGEKAGVYVMKNKGAVKVILDYIQENRLLTS